MTNVFLVSDTHFGHQNICKFKNNDGTPLRPWDDVAEMDEEMVKRWNDTICLGVISFILGVNSHKLASDDLSINIFVGILVSLLWPLCLSLIILLAPFVVVFLLGNRYRKHKLEKEKVWQTLKN